MIDPWVLFALIMSVALNLIFMEREIIRWLDRRR